ncbi:MFS transporter [Amycolatopsis australiensis]|uniref:Sugar phosphate permease n=1 Tax=Amycolatopsis australiensis TaxID=546364 RepID=A0A1K1SEP2_9PSEU|nr:MFS transporter [Amycolatopsis australiensis]SFW82766.1 Sugar phosphate permease [Amycolatopsis australiensis]
MTTAEKSRTRTAGRTRWTIAGVLGVGSFVNYVDRVNLSIAGPEMMREFHLSAAQLGVVASAFLWTYAVLQLPIGAIIDRIGVRWVNRAAALLWAVASFLTASAGGLGLLMVSRLVLGFGEAPTIPAGWQAIGQWFPRAERGRATAIFDGCAKISNVLGIPVMAFLVTAFGWHSAFVFTGILSLGYLLVWWLLYLTPKQALARGRLSPAEFAYLREGGADDEDAPTPSSLTGLGNLLRRRKTWGLALGYASYTYAYYVLLTWLPGYLEKQFGVKLLAGGLYTMIPWLVAVLAQFLVGGIVLDRLIARSGDETKARRIVLVVSMLVSLSVAGAAYAGSVAVALVFLSIGAAGLAVSVPAGSSIVAVIAPEGCSGTLGGLVNFVANLIGIAAPIVTGAVVDVTGSFAGAFLVTGVVLLAGIFCYTVVLGRLDRMPAAPRKEIP